MSVELTKDRLFDIASQVMRGNAARAAELVEIFEWARGTDDPQLVAAMIAKVAEHQEATR